MRYRVLQTLALPQGASVILTEQQAAARKPALRALGKGLHEVLAPVSFKSGEVVGFEPHAPKRYAGLLEQLPARAAPQRTTEAA